MIECDALTIECRKDSEGKEEFYLTGPNADKYDLVTEYNGRYVKFGIACKKMDNKPGVIVHK